MKTRGGFVSNSSSTSFTFVFKGGTMDDLERVIKAHAGRFKLTHEWDPTHRTNAVDVVRHIRKCLALEARLGRPAYCDAVAVVPLSQKVAELRRERLAYARWRREELAKDGHMGRYYQGLLDLSAEEARRLRSVIRKARRAGLDSALVIKFGDNDGDVCGVAAGYCLDAARDDLWIEEDDLIVIPENCH